MDREGWVSRLLTGSSKIESSGEIWCMELFRKVCSEVVRRPVLVCVPGFTLGMHRAQRAASWQDEMKADTD